MLKRVLSIIMVLLLMVSLSACAPKSNNTTDESKTPGTTGNVDTKNNVGSDEAKETKVNRGKASKIGVAFYQDSGAAVTATKNYLESIQDELNVTFVYTVLSLMDEATNLSKIQELIASGVDGIITTMDSGTPAIISECEAAGVYIGGYLVDFDISYNTAFDQVFKSEFFVGTAADGQNPDDVTAGTTFFNSLIEYNERNSDNPINHVSLVIFPDWAFPSQTIAANQFIAAVEDYNKTAANPITVDPLDKATDVLPFSPLDSTYFAKHPNIEAIMSFAAGDIFVYPVMVASGVDKDIKLFTTGFNGGEVENFGTAGNQTFQQVIFTQVESINYALVLLLNKINEVEFKDQPEFAERISTSQAVVSSDADLEIIKTKSIFFNGDASKSLYTGEEVLNMTAYANPNATYADLKKMLSKLTVEDLAAK